MALGLIRDEVAGFYWIQDGTPAGNHCYYGVLLKGDARILRAGVVPSRRRQGVYTQLTRDLLYHLTEQGVRRVYVECTERNIASLRAHVRAGFRPIGCIRVVGGALAAAHVRWGSPDRLIDDLSQEGVPIPRLAPTE